MSKDVKLVIVTAEYIFLIFNQTSVVVQPYSGNMCVIFLTTLDGWYFGDKTSLIHLIERAFNSLLRLNRLSKCSTIDNIRI